MKDGWKESVSCVIKERREMYKLIKTRNPNNKFDLFNISVESDGDDDNITLPELSGMFRQFLEAVGYGYIERVVFITEDGKEITEEV